MRLWPVSLVVTGCFATPTRPEGDGTTYRRPITLVQPPSEQLEAFPVSVLLEDDAGVRDHADGAAHIAFRMGDGTELRCEIVHVSATGTLEAWVLLPMLSTTTPTTFELAYGPDVTTTCDPAMVWSDYRGVWHLSETLPGAARDSSSYGHALTPLDGDMPAPMPGIVGNGRRYDPTDTAGADQLCIDNAPGLQLEQLPFSYELWVNQERYLGSYDSALHKGGASAGSPGFDLELGLNQWTAFLRDDVDPANRVELSDDSSTLVNAWHHLAVTVDRSAGFIRAYRDGLLADSEALVIDSVSGTASLCLGRREVPMIGWLDEARIHSAARSAAWFEMTYANVALRSTFMIIGDER